MPPLARVLSIKSIFFIDDFYNDRMVLGNEKGSGNTSTAQIFHYEHKVYTPDLFSHEYFTRDTLIPR